MRFVLCILSAILVLWYIRGGHARSQGCSGILSDCNDSNSVCVNGNCSCVETHEEVSNDCKPKTCTAANVATNCGINLYCTSAGECACAATYEIRSDEQWCTSKTCNDSNPSYCAEEDTNSYCNTTLPLPTCTCKMNYDEPNTETCTRKNCTTNVDCSVTNAYCATGTAGGCTCGITTIADSTTGACTVKNCTPSEAINANTSCGASNAVCELSSNTYLCACGANYEAGATACTQKACTTDSNCDADSVCTNSLCECKSDFRPSGSTCKKACATSSDCGSNASCVNTICECFGNFEGNGESCTPMNCSDSTTTTCHPNSVCNAGVCMCATDYVAKATACFKTCTTNDDCSSNGQCIDSTCVCMTNYVGDGANCTRKSCTQDSDCGAWSGSVCSSGQCTGSATIAVYSFPSMLFAFLMTIFFNKM